MFVVLVYNCAESPICLQAASKNCCKITAMYRPITLFTPDRHALEFSKRALRIVPPYSDNHLTLTT